MPFTNLRLAMADSTNAVPAIWDMDKVINTQLVEARRRERLIVSRMVENRTNMFTANGMINRQVDFTKTGGYSVEKHGLGDKHVGSNRNSIQRRVTLDERMLKVVDDHEHITDLFNQVDLESNIPLDMADALAEHQDVEVLKAICDASAFAQQGSEDVNEFYIGGGSTVVIGTTIGDTRALKILDAIRLAAIEFTKKAVPSTGRHVVISPEDWWQIAEVEEVKTGHGTLVGGIYGNNDIVGGKIDFTQHLDENMAILYRGFMIWQSNGVNAEFNPNLQGLKTTASTRHVIDPDFNNRGGTFSAGGDFDDVEGVIFQSSCVGLTDIMQTIFTEEDLESSTIRQRVAMTWIGLNTFTPEAAVTIISA